MSKCKLCTVQIPYYKKEMTISLKDSEGEYKHEVLFGIVGRHRFYASENNQIIQFVNLNYCPECGRELNDS